MCDHYIASPYCTAKIGRYGPVGGMRHGLRVLVRDGNLPCHRFPGGREMRFLRDELIEWLRGLPSGASPDDRD